MKVVERSVESLIPYARNPRKNDHAVDSLAALIKEVGFKVPMVIDSEGVIVTGHTRLKAAKKLGMETVPCVVADDLTPQQIKAFRLLDNKVAEKAEWDGSLLALELDEVELDLEPFDVDFDPDITGIENTAEVTEDEAPELRPIAVSRLGDLWILGDHRLLCGDSTKQADVERLMNGELADLVFTDPPYGVNYDGGTTKREKLQGDENVELFEPTCRFAFKFSKKNSALYLWHAGIKGFKAAAAAAAAAAGWEIRAEIIWNKNLAQFGALSAQYKQKHEPCYYCVKKGNPPQWFGPTNEVTVWDVNRASVNEFHPTQKPIELAVRAMGNSSRQKDIVLDFFSGSGSTIIAAEHAGRRGRAMEISPQYVDVAIRRWQQLTGKTAVLESGETFAEREAAVL